MQKIFIWRERLKVNQKETDESHKINLIMDLCCSDNEKVRLNFFQLHISNIMLVLLFQTYFIITYISIVVTFISIVEVKYSQI